MSTADQILEQLQLNNSIHLFCLGASVAILVCLLLYKVIKTFL